MANDIRNLAIIAHVDHGKTTLIDGLFRQSGVFEAHKKVEERVMDSNALEKERGITIKAKNASFLWKGTKINIVDTPGHADFGGEVERALFMVDGALLLVDAAEGPLPQTRFVLKKALERNLKIILVINKIDRPDARVEEIEEKALELFYDLANNDKHVSYKTVYASAKTGFAKLKMEDENKDLSPLLDLIVDEIPPPKVTDEGDFKMLVTNLTYNSFVGQIAVGRIESGSVKLNEKVKIHAKNGKTLEFNITSLEAFQGLGTAKVETLTAGNIALLAGAPTPKIGDSITALTVNEALPRIKIDPPAISVRISVNTSPGSGTEGEYLTSRKLEEVLTKACLTNVALQMEATDSPEVFILKARGELQIGILLEELRREGYELMVGRPEIIPIEENGEQFEPEEMMIVDIPDDMVGVVTNLLSQRGGKMEVMEPLEASQRVRLEFSIPTRGLIGIRSKLLTETRGKAIFSSSIKGYIPFKGKRFSRVNGALVSDRNGDSVEYGLYHLQERGKLFVKENERVYEGMVIGEASQLNDMNVNPCKAKKLTNIRTVNKDDSTKLDPIQELDLDRALEWIDEDEWVEVTPKKVRIRKGVLDSTQRGIIRR